MFKKPTVLLTLLCVLMTVLMPGGRIVSADPPGTAAVKQETSKTSKHAKTEGPVTRPVSAALLPGTVAAATYDPPGLLWQVGTPDNSSAEFTVYNNVYSNLTLPLPAGSWNTVAKGMKADVNGTVNLTFDLAAVSEHGVEFSFRVICEITASHQFDVFTNGHTSELVQVSVLNIAEAALYNT
ncbi:hypothetical protein AMQ83_31320 [Paenibacillus riograndensis]|nr:hypothetical protein AMQ83_31320 [Paenibacillus riograndensis]